MAETKPQSLGVRLWKLLSGFGLATTLLVVLGILTWLATLEMVDAGLIFTLRKYFHWTAWYVVPEINGKSMILPLPGGYWVCALLLVNLTLGGLIRARKGVKTIGVLMAHFGIIFMVAAGGVAQLFEVRGVMMLVEGDEADYAISLTRPTIEVMEVEDGEVVGEVLVADEPQLTGLDAEDTRRLQLAGLPFDLEITGWTRNSVVKREDAGSERPAIDGWVLEKMPRNKEGELDAPGCYARAVFPDGSRGESFILAVPQPTSGLNAYDPVMVEAEGRRFAVRMVKQTIPVPYTVKLEDAVAEYYPNSFRPKSFMSDIERIESGAEPVPVRIEMNQPMRRGGFTFFQRTMSGGPQMREGPEFSGFEVVSNPADKWPEYSLYVVALGLGIQFMMKFVGFLGRPSRKQAPA